LGSGSVKGGDEVGGFGEYHLIDTAGYQMEGNDASMGRKRPLWLV
jgi:hypothetical protein